MLRVPLVLHLEPLIVARRMRVRPVSPLPGVRVWMMICVCVCVCMIMCVCVCLCVCVCV